MKKSILIIVTFILLFNMHGYAQTDTTRVIKIVVEDEDSENEAEESIEEAKKEIEEAIEEAKEEINEEIEEMNEEIEDIEEELEEEFNIKVKIPKFSQKDKKPKKIKNVNTRYLLVDFGSNILLHKEDGTQFSDDYDNRFDQNVWKSRNWNIHLFRQRFNLIKHHVNIEWGLSLNFHKLYLTGRDSFTVDINYDIKEKNFENVKLQANYLTLPILLNFETNPKHLDKSFHISAGGYVGFLMGGNFKHRSDYYGRVKIKKDLGLNSISYGLTGSIGYGHLNIYGSFNMQSLFEKEKDVNMLSVGVQILPY